MVVYRPTPGSPASKAKSPTAEATKLQRPRSADKPKKGKRRRRVTVSASVERKGSRQSIRIWTVATGAKHAVRRYNGSGDIFDLETADAIFTEELCNFVKKNGKVTFKIQ